MGILRTYAAAVARRVQGFAPYRRVVGRLVARGMTVREATAADMLEVGGVITRPGMAPAPWRNCDAIYFASRCHGRFAGSVRLARYPPDHPWYVGYWLDSLSVRPVFRGAGIGEALSREVVERAHAEGAPTLDLTVDNDNLRAIRLYRKLGFEMHVIEALEPRLVAAGAATGRRRVVMRKRLGTGE